MVDFYPSRLAINIPGKQVLLKLLAYKVIQYSLQTVRPRRYSENLNVSVLCPLHQISGCNAITIVLRLRTKLLKQVK